MVTRPTVWVWNALMGCLLVVICYGTVGALQSTNYRLDEEAIGTGNMLQSSSNNYQARDGVNDLAIGTSGSNNYQIVAGAKTDPYPWLSLVVNSSNVDFGVLSPATIASGTVSFSVVNYTSFGYVVQIEGPTPTNGNHALNSLISGPAVAGVEAFGLNLVANTQPTNPLGANPDNGQFGFGTVATNYSTPDAFYYASGDTIASAPKSSGMTTYTISYVLSVAPLTPGGRYTTGQSLIVTGTY